MTSAYFSQVLLGRENERSWRFLKFTLALSVVAAVVYAVPTVLERQSSVAILLLGGIVVIAFAGASVQAYYNGGLIVGGVGMLILLTTVFLVSEIILTVKPVYGDSRALPMYLTFAGIAVSVGVAASIFGMAGNHVTS